MKKTIVILLAAVFLFCLSELISAEDIRAGKKTSELAVSADDAVTITVLHTNNIQAKTTNDETEKIIGFAKLKTVVRLHTVDLVLDAGSLYSAPEGNDPKRGERIADLIKAIPYDGMAAGNTDWAFGKDRLLALETRSGVPILSGNIYADQNLPLFRHPYLIKTIKGVAVGVFAVSDAASLSSKDGLFTKDPAEYAQTMVSELKNKTDIIFCLAHSTNLSALAGVEGIDLLLTGGGNQMTIEKSGNVIVTQMNDNLQNIGLVKIDYSLKQKRIIKRVADFVPFADTVELPEDAEMAALIQKQSIG